MTETRSKKGGRPQDPQLASRVHESILTLLARDGLDGLTGDKIAELTGCGKASVYRRWPSLDLALVEVVREKMGPDVPEPSGSVRADLVALLRACCAGEKARAELAILSAVPWRPGLREAYAGGPEARLSRALCELSTRAGQAGERWPGDTVVRAALALLRHAALVADREPGDDLVCEVLDRLAPVPAEL